MNEFEKKNNIFGYYTFSYVKFLLHSNMQHRFYIYLFHISVYLLTGHYCQLTL